MDLLRFRLTLAGRAANPCTVFGVGFAVGVDVEQFCDIVNMRDKLSSHATAISGKALGTLKTLETLKKPSENP